MLKKQWVKLNILILAALLFCSGCVKGSIKIGFMVDLTGRASGTGITGRNGAEIAVDEINKAGGIKGRNISLIIKDDKGLPEEAVKIDQELINEEVLLAIGHLTSGTGIPGLELFNKAGILMISPLMSTDSLSGIDDCFIRFIDTNKKQGELLAEAALSDDLKNGVAVVYEYNNRAYSAEVAKFFELRYKKSGGRIVYEDSFNSSPSTDLGELAAKIVASGADGVMIACGGVDLGVLTQKIKGEKPEVRIYSGMWGMTDDAVAKGGRAIEGTYFAGVYDKMNQAPDFIKFRTTYMDQYNEEPTYASLYCYETVKIIAEALKSVDQLSTEEIKRQILSTKELKGLQEDFNLDRYGDSDRGYFLFRVENSDFVRVK